MGIAGASRFLGASTLANTQGRAAQSSTVLDQASTGPTSLLDSGRRFSAGGAGLSSSARQLNQSFLNRSSDINAMFSLAVGSSATTEGAAQQILALRAGLTDSQLAPSLRSDAIAEAEGEDAITTETTFSRELPPASAVFANDTNLFTLDDGGISEAETGQAVDTTA